MSKTVEESKVIGDEFHATCPFTVPQALTAFLKAIIMKRLS